MKKRLLFLSFSILFLIKTYGQKTWSEHIAPIMYKNCTNCHHKGGAAPFSLMTYKEASSFKLSIHHAVESGHMPPWPPDNKYSALAFSRALSDADKQAILDWVDGGAKEGDASKTPTPPTYRDGGAIANPSFTARIPQYTVTGNKDIYRCFPMKSNLAADKFITSLECLPGNGSIVHHVLIFQDQANTCYDLDAKDPGPGYTNFGGVGSNSATLIGAWVPGSQPTIFPKGMGMRLKANSNIILQVHYAPGSDGQSDSTQLRLKLSDGPMREVLIAPILNHVTSLTNGPLFIPANTTKTFNSQFTIPADVTVIAVAPHMHVIGKKIKAFGVTPTGDTIKLIKIDDWDFHWQGSYMFKKAIKAPRNSKLYGEAFYDNTLNNIHNPSSPPKDVSLGEATTDEMMLIYFTFLLYQAGDENLDLEQAVLATDVDDYPLSKMDFSCYPNPAKDNINVRFNLEKEDNFTIQVFDYQGVLIKNIATNQYFNQGQTEKLIQVGDLKPGVYFVTMRSDKMYGAKMFIKE